MAKKEPTLKEVIAELQEVNKKNLKIAKENLSLKEMEKKIVALQQENYEGDNKNIDLISKQFEEINRRIRMKGAVENYARDQIEALQELVKSEEEIREKERLAQEQIDSNEGIAAGLQGLQESLNNMVDKAAKGAGILGVAMLLFDPELLMDILFGALEMFQKAVSTISVIFKKYVSPLIEAIGAETLLFVGGIAWVVAKLGIINKIVATYKGVIKAWEWAQTSLKTGMLGHAKKLAQIAYGKVSKGITTAITSVRAGMVSVSTFLSTTGKDLLLATKGKIIQGIKTAITSVRAGMVAIGTFMTGTVLPAITGALTAAWASIAPVLVAAAPFIAIGAAIGAAVYAIVESFKNAVSVFEETGSISEAIATFALDVITAPVRWLKNLASWVLEALGFEKAAAALDEIDITASIISGIKAMFTGTINWINETFGIDIATVMTDFWNSVTDGMGLIGLVTKPFRMIGDWIAEKFGFTAPEGEDGGFVTNLVKGWVDEFTAWLSGILGFDFSSLVPDWAKKFIPGSEGKEEGPKDLTKLSNAELREMARKQADDEWFGDEDEIFAKLFAERKAQKIKNLEERARDKQVASPIRDTQVENNALKDQEAAKAAVTVVNAPQAPAPAPAANVSSTSVNMTNSLDMDRLTREFAFSPASAAF